MGLLVQSDMATPVISDLGTQGADRGVPEAGARAATRSRRSASASPNAGSDVAGIETVARRDGDDYVINGSKTFITNGTRADFVTLLVEDASPSRARTAAASSSCRRRPKGFNVAQEAEEDRQPRRATPPSSPSKTCASPSATCSARRTWASCTSCRTSRPSASSPASSAMRRLPLHDRRRDRLRPRPQGVRQADHQARVLAAQVRRPLHEARGGPGPHLQGVDALQRRQVRQEGQRSRWRR